MILKINDSDCFQKCVDALRSEQVVILPTDTIYGFSGIVPSTKDKIMKIKNRPSPKKMIQLIAKPEDVYKYTNQIIPDVFFNLWPAALTLIVRAKTGKDTIGFRCPRFKWLNDLIEAVGTPIFSSSVNISGSENLNNIAKIAEAFEKSVALIIDAGDKTAAPSTVVDLTLDEPMILRRGSLEI